MEALCPLFIIGLGQSGLWRQADGWKCIVYQFDHIFIFFPIWICSGDSGSHYVAQVGFELNIVQVVFEPVIVLLPQHS